MKKWMVMLALMMLGAAPALAADWKSVAEVTADRQAAATELAVNREIRTVRLKCTEGAVLVNTLWVREGGAKTEIRVARRFNAGDEQDIDLGYKRNVTGFRMSNQGPGKLKVLVK